MLVFKENPQEDFRWEENTDVRHVSTPMSFNTKGEKTPTSELPSETRVLDNGNRERLLDPDWAEGVCCDSDETGVEPNLRMFILQLGPSLSSWHKDVWLC